MKTTIPILTAAFATLLLTAPTAFAEETHERVCFRYLGKMNIPIRIPCPSTARHNQMHNLPDANDRDQHQPKDKDHPNVDETPETPPAPSHP